MQVFLTVLYVILGVIGGLLLLIFLLTLIPLRAELRFRGEFELTAKYLFFRIPLLPGKPEEGKEEPEEEKPKEPGKPGMMDRVRAALKREGLGGFLQALGELIGLLGEASKGILKRLKLRHFDLYLCVAGAEDAAAGAQLYGKICAGVYPACGALFGLLPCKRKGVTVDLDYGLAESRTDFSAELSILPIFAVVQGLRLALKSLRPLKKIL